VGIRFGTVGLVGCINGPANAEQESQAEDGYKDVAMGFCHIEVSGFKSLNTCPDESAFGLFFSDNLIFPQFLFIRH
jgi:hypothetical protein